MSRPGHERRPQDQGAPGELPGGLILKVEAPSLPAPPAQGQQGQTVAGIGDKHVRQGVHERDPGYPEFPVQGGRDV